MRILTLLLLCSHLLAAQRLSHPLHAEASRNERRTAAAAFPDTLRILAIMVQFQTDTDSRTSGNGQFDLTATDERIIDPPPHDSAYVADHFRFANNYYSRASNQKQFVSATVLGRVITLKKQMKDYAPIGGNLPLAAMIDEAWKAADSLYPGFPFEQYGMFAVFHAGVGKDIDLRAALGYDPTPLDLPSLYFSFDALRSLFGSSFTGITLKNSSFKIPNTVVLPETEVRRIPGVGGDIVLKLGLNGLLVASIGSHLGLPDLFDTKTGRTAIGRFGLMDGQSIFSFYGMAPPEPSAWEKIRLGWTTPIEVPGNALLSLPAAGLHSAGNDTVYKVPISAKEYYLIENRHRDVNGNGNTVTVKWKGTEQTLAFPMDTTFYSNSGIDSVYGTVVNVEELDWSLPGLVNTNNKYFGGILIWHIDESVIDRTIASNTVNADATRRGIDLEEADGSQDIGKSYPFGDPASGTEDGSPIDYWFSGNIFPNYTNTFSETTLPNSLTNTFARSGVTIKDFSERGVRMTAVVDRTSAPVRLIASRKRPNIGSGNDDSPIVTDIDGNGTPEVIYTSGDSIYVLDRTLAPFQNNTTGLFAPYGGRRQPVVVPSLGDANLGPVFRGIAGQTSAAVHLFRTNDRTKPLADTAASFLSASAITSPLLYESANNGTLQFGTAGKELSLLQYAPNNGTLVRSANHTVIDTPRFLFREPGVTYMASNNNIFTLTMNLGVNTGIRSGTLMSLGSGSSAASFLPAVLTNDTFAPLMLGNDRAALPGPLTSAFAAVDADNDNVAEILIGSAQGLLCVNQRGVLREGFPLKVLDGGSVTGSPLVVKMKGSEETAVIFGSTNGHLYAYTLSGRMLNGFPLQTGGITSTPALLGDTLIVASTDSSLYFWDTKGIFDASRQLWNNYLADHFHSNYKVWNGSASQRTADLLPKKYAYNWPNPVYSGATNIRYYLARPAAVTITIVNMAGELVQKLNGSGHGGLDNEVPWDITNVQSGIYFAQITAAGSGEETSQIVKIAVVK